MKIGTFETTCSLHFDPEKLRKCINLYYLGQENCNEYNNDNEIVPIQHPRLNEVVKVQNNLCPNVRITIQADLDENGIFTNIRVKKRG